MKLKTIGMVGVLALAATLTNAQEPLRIKMTVIPGALRFAVEAFEVNAGAEVEIDFQNNGLMQHNLLITTPGSADKVVLAAMALGTQGLAKNFVPDGDDVLFASGLVNPNESEVLQFTAPSAAGDYPFVCTFPGHGNTMRGIMHVKPAGAAIAAATQAEQKEREIVDTFKDVTYSNQPLGSPEKPLIIRTFVPNPQLPAGVLAHHHQGFPASEYSPNTGRDRPGIVDPVNGIPAAIAVNMGEGLSFCWDTTECRLLYAWSGGFLDFDNYWGGNGGGGRKRFDYVPRLQGNIFFKALGEHPYGDLGDDLRYLGFKLEDGVPVFRFRIGSAIVSEKITPAGEEAMLVKCSIENAPRRTRLHFDLAARPMINANKGEWDGDTLVLNRDEAKDFELTIK